MPTEAPPLHIAHLIKGLGRGGAEMLLPQLLRNSSPALTFSVGYFLPWKSALQTETEKAGANVRCFGGKSAPGMLLRLPKVVSWLRGEGADVVHAHLPWAGVVARLAGRLAGVPVVYTEHNLLERYNPWTRRADLATWRLQKAAIAVSREVADSLVRHNAHGVPLLVVRNGIEIQELPEADMRAAVRKELGIFSRAPVVGSVAVFRKQKRLDLWLQAAKGILESAPEARFLLVGDGPLRDEVEQQAKLLGLRDNITFTGLQADVRPYLAAMDLYLVTSDFEGLPLALLEAMAAGLPIVTTSVGGIPEVVEHTRSGFLVHPGDVGGMVAAAMIVVKDVVTARRLGEAARQRAVEHFDIRRMAQELEAIYRQYAG